MTSKIYLLYNSFNDYFVWPQFSIWLSFLRLCNMMIKGAVNPLHAKQSLVTTSLLKTTFANPIHRDPTLTCFIDHFLLCYIVGKNVLAPLIHTKPIFFFIVMFFRIGHGENSHNSKLTNAN